MTTANSMKPYRQYIESFLIILIGLALGHFIIWYVIDPEPLRARYNFVNGMILIFYSLTVIGNFKSIQAVTRARRITYYFLSSLGISVALAYGVLLFA